MCIAGKRYRIKSRGKFTLFVTFAIIVAVMLVNTVLGFDDASSLTRQTYLEIKVRTGDTLWNIAKEYMPNTDIRRSVHVLCDLNEISSHELQAGQILLVPMQSDFV